MSDQSRSASSILQSESKSSFPIALICTTTRRMPVGAGTNQGPENGDLTTLWDREGERGRSARLLQVLDLYWRSSGSGNLWYTSMQLKEAV